ncbi:unnamed protein product [Zymoseptoria tritici ST99CH_1E4]|nr:unnamed protein product [Zymoseptoria tritici ST99CH_1E4]
MRGNDRSPCGINKKDPVDPYFKNGDMCDESPYAAVTQGGAGAVLACVSKADNSNEGKQLSSFTKAKEGCNNEAPCDFTLMLKEGTYDNIGYCNSERTNRGDEFKLSNGKYVNAKRSESVVAGDVDDDQVFELHVPDPALFIAPHERRQCLLADGHRTLLMGRHTDKNFVGTVIVHGDGTSSTVVKELFGDEKSPQFRPTIL